MQHIAYCFDRNYQQHFGASITSLLLNFEGMGDDLCIHVFTDAIDAPFESRIERLQSRFRATLRIYSPSAAIMNGLADLPTAGYLTKATYLNLMLATMLPAEVGKVLYLDADTIVLADIQALLAEDMAGKSLAAVDDFSAAEMIRYWSISKYFNTGVMLLDLQRWREFDYTNRCIAFSIAKRDNLKYANQCAINMVLAGDITSLPSRWNGFVMPDVNNPDIGKAAILHYITASKPWQSWYEHPLGKHYWRYLDVSPWSGPVPERPKTRLEAIRLARLLSQQGRDKESIRIYENILGSLAR